MSKGYRIKAPVIDGKLVHYKSDGTGRDNYIG